MKRVFALLLAALLVLSLAGCQVEETRRKKKTESAEDALQDSLEALAEGGTMMLAPDGSAVGMNPATGVASCITGALEFEIRSVKERSSSATAELEISAPDAVALVQQALEDMETFDEAVFLEKLEQLAENAEKKTFSVTVELTLADDCWCIIPNAEFSNAITGGLTGEYAAVRQSILDALTKGGEEE